MNQPLDKLSWSVRALAQPAKIQKLLFPSFVVVADELALEFDDHYKNALTYVSKNCNESQIAKLELLDKQLDSMSGSDKPHLWLEDDCLDHPEWSTVRAIAKDVINMFDWPIEIPSPSSALYVSGGSQPE